MEEDIPTAHTGLHSKGQPCSLSFSLTETSHSHPMAGGILQGELAFPKMKNEQVAGNQPQDLFSMWI